MLHVGTSGRRNASCLALNFGRCTDVRRFTLDVGTLDVGPARWTLDITLGVVRSAVRMLGRWTFGRVTLDVGRWTLDVRMFDVGCWPLDVGRWTLDVRMFDVGCCTLYDRHVDDDGHPGRVGRWTSEFHGGRSMLDVSMLTLEVGRWTVGTLGRWDVGTLGRWDVGTLTGHLQITRWVTSVITSEVKKKKCCGGPASAAYSGHSQNQDGSSSAPWLKGSLSGTTHVDLPIFLCDKKGVSLARAA